MPKPSSTEREAAAALLRELDELAWAGQHVQTEALASQALQRPGLSDAQQLALLDRRAESRTACAQTAQALDDALQMQALAGDSAALQATALLRLAAVQTRMDRLAEAEASAAQALACTGRSRQPPLRARALLRLAEVQFRRYDNEASRRHARAAAEGFQALGDRVGLGRARWVEAYACDQLELPRERDRLAAEALALARETGDQEGIGAAANLLYREHADMAQRLQGLKASLAAFAAAGQPERAGAALGNLAMAYGSIGLYARAREPSGLTPGIREMEAIRQANPYYAAMQSAIEGQLGHHALAQSLAEQAVAAADGIDDPWFHVIVKVVQARAERLAGHSGRARGLLEQAVEQASYSSTLRVLTLTELGALCVESGDAAAALAATQQAVRLLKQRGDTGLGSMFTPATAWWWHVRALQANGLHAQAQRALATGYRVMLQGVASLSDEGLRRSWFANVAAHRQLVRAWIDEGRARGLPPARWQAHLRAHTQLREPFERLAEAGVRMNQLHDSAMLQQFLVDEAVELCGAERLLLVLPQGDGLQVAGAQLPPGEEAGPLLQAVRPWLDEAAHTRLASLRHGPPGAEPLDQRSCIVAPLLAQRELLGWLYADIDGAFGRFHDADRNLLAMLAGQAAVALANLRTSEGLEATVAARTAELRQRAEELELLNRIQQGIAAELDFQAVVDLVGNQLREVFPERDVSIFWWDEAAGLSRGLYVMLHGRRILVPPLQPNRDSAIARALAQGQPVVANDRAEMAAWGMRAIPGKQLAMSTAIVPIMVGERHIGSIGLNDHARENAFGEAELRLLGTVAAGLGVGLENARLFDETKVALEQQQATAEVLAVIGRSVSDAQPVFDSICTGLQRLLPGADLTISALGEDGRIHWRAGSGELMETMKGFFPRPAPARELLTGAASHWPDVMNGPDVPEGLRAAARVIGRNISLLSAAMVSNDQVYGSITAIHTDMRPFSEREGRLIKAFADQAVIAIQNARLFRETQEALERQTASAEVLQVISGSVADTQPVFERILAGCNRLFAGTWQSIFLFDEESRQMRLAAHHGMAREVLDRIFPLPLKDGHPLQQPLRDGRVLCFDDVLEGPDVVPEARKVIEAMGFGNCSQVFVPLVWNGRGIGTLVMVRTPPLPFSEADIAQIRTFADQAVIAIQNARLFHETREALERQTATAEVLEVISSSVADAQPVFDKILASCARLFQSDEQGVILLGNDGLAGVAAHRGPALPDLQRYYAERKLPNKAYAPAILEGKSICVMNALDPAVHWTLRSVAEHLQIGPYSHLLAPMAWEGQPIGWLYVIRQPADGFSDKEAALLETFADQAVIAIQNARMFNETQEALERQTATAEVLRAIAASPDDVQPVFDAIAERARVLCGAVVSGVSRFDGEWVHLAAMDGVSDDALDTVRAAFPIHAGSGSINARAVRDRAPVHIADVLADAGYEAKAAAERAGYRSGLAVPMLKDGRVVGAIAVFRAEAGRFAERQVQLLQTFADQAVIAIENVRLFNETKDALERQTATAEVLKSISHSIADSRPVFEQIMRSCQRLFKVGQVGIALVGEDGLMHFDELLTDDVRQNETTARADAMIRAQFPMPPERSIHGLALQRREVLHFPDVADGPGVPEGLRRTVELLQANYSIVIAPMLWQDRGLGAIQVVRMPPEPFASDEIEQLRTFADQAVIALQNTRMFLETQEARAAAEAANEAKSAFLATMSH